MRIKMKRLLAFVLAVVLALGTVLTGNAFSLQSWATGIPDTFDASVGFTNGSAAVPGVEAGIPLTGLNFKVIPMEGGAAVPGVIYSTIVNDAASATITGIEKKDGRTFSYELTHDNYNITPAQGTLDVDNPTITITAVSPKYMVNGITGETDMEISGSQQYTATVDNQVWKDQVTWSVGGEGASYVTLKYPDGTEVQGAPLTGNSCLLTAAAELPENKDSVEIILTATDKNNVSVTKTVRVRKKTTEITGITFDPSSSTWGEDMTVKASVAPQEAGRTVEFFADGTSIGTQTTDSTGTASITWKASELKAYVIKAQAAGTKTYSRAEKEVSYTPGKASQTFSYEQKNDNLTYGDTNVVVASITDNGTGRADPEYEIRVIEGAAKVVIDGKDVLLTPNKAGTVKFQIIKNGDDKYTEAVSDVFEVIVNKKTVSKLTAKVKTDRVYNGEKEVEGVTATIDPSDLVGVDKDKEVQLSAVVGQMDKADAGNGKKVTATFTNDQLPDAYKDKYTLGASGIPVETTVNISKKKLSLTVGSASVEHQNMGDLSRYVFVENTKVSVEGVVKGDEGLMNQLGFLPLVKADLTGVTGVGEYTDVLYAVKDETGSHGNPGNNYYFDFENQKKGSLEVLPETIPDGEVSEFVSINNCSSKQVYQNNSKVIYYRSPQNAGDTEAKFKIENETYSKIYMVVDGTEKDVTDGLVLEATGNSGNQTIYFLLKSEDGKKTTNKFAIDFICDDIVPEINLTISNNSKVIKDFANAITFGIFSNASTLKAEVKVNDDASGLKPWKYCVVSTKTDIVISKDNYSEYFKDPVSVEESSCEIELNKKDGNYILLVAVSDHVGNQVLYSSQGVVIDHVAIPEDEITLNRVSTNYKEYSDDTNGQIYYYNGNAQFSITAHGNADDVFSGIGTISYKAVKENEKVESGTYEYDNEKNEDDGYTIKDLGDKFNSITTSSTFTITATDEGSTAVSQKIDFTIEVTDLAGNMQTRSESFVIDNVAPQMSSSLSDGAANEIYYNKDVALTTVITERYLDPSSVDYTINGESVTLAALQNMDPEERKSSYGIINVTVPEWTEYKTDNEESIIKLTFSEDNHYTVKISATDRAGNSVDSEEIKFVVDKTAPKAKLLYYKYGDGSQFLAGASADDICYLGIDYNSFVAEITVDELNFSDLKTVAANFTINAEDSGKHSILGDATGAYTSNARKAEKWNKEENAENVYKYSIELTEDANYNFAFDYVDMAGNAVVFTDALGNVIDAPTDFITLDKTLPTGTVRVYDLVNSRGKTDQDKNPTIFDKFIEAISFGWFGRNHVNVSMTGEDATAGVKSQKYITKEYKTTDELLDKDALARIPDADWSDYGLDSTEKKLKYDATQNIVVYERVEDKAGNVAFFSSENVVIDKNVSNIKVAITPENPGYKKGVYNAGEIRHFTVDVKEPVVTDNDQAYAGIKTIEYELIESNNITGEVKSSRNELKSYDDKDHIRDHSENIAIQPNLDYSYDYTIIVYVEDWSGNTSQSEPFTIIIDPVVPVITNTYPVDEAKNGKYFNKDVVVTSTITERYLDIYKDLTYIINGKTVTLAELSNRKAEFGVSGITVDHNDTNRTDTSTSTVKVTFHDDNNYSVSTYVTDKAGNRSAETEKTIFVVDQTAPKATLTYYSYGNGDRFDAGKSPDSIMYLGEDYNSFKAEVTVEELNFTDGSTVAADYVVNAENIIIEKKDENILKELLKGYTDNAKTANAWQNLSETTHKYSVDIHKDANYTFDFAYTDLAGNPLQVEVSTDYITLDRVRPAGTVTIDGLVNGTVESGNATSKSWVTSFIESITFGLFGKDGLSATMDSEDATAGIAQMQYLYTSEYLTREALALRTDWTDYSGAIGLNANQNVIVYQKVVDKAGNTEYYSTDQLIADNVDPAPVVTITPSSPSWNKGVYSAGDNPGFDITVTDPVVNEAYSGLKDISYKIVNGTTGYTEEGTLAAINRNAHQQSWTGHVSINPEAFYSNDVQVTVTASDWSTNKATSETARLKVDNKAPIVKFSFDTSDALNGKYYKNNKTLTITVDERNFDPSYTPTVTSTAGGGYAFSGWSTTGEISTGTITFSGDSDYTVTFDCYDLAGNKSNTERQEEFTVDKTLPTISVAYDNNSVLNGKYYKAPRTATIIITEHNFRASEVRVTTTAALNGGAIAAPTAGGWSSYGDRHTAVVSFPGDGDYTFDITYSDLAGNASADYAQDSFTVDKTNPELEISGVKDKSANKGTVAPIITLSDVNFDTENIVLTLTGANKGKVPVDGMVTRSNRAGGATISFKNFGKDMDDIYTLTAKTTDKAGNDTSKTITFSVNRNGSTYIINEATQKLLDTGFTNDPQNLVIQEINVDTLKFVELTYSKDGQVVKLTEGKDYTVKAEGGDGQWKKYTYTILASCFEEEGEYTINIYSEDRAANTTTNKVKGKSIEFIVDKTPPTVSIANLENRGRYREDVHQFTLSVKDNTVLSYVELYLDGELVHTYTGDELNVVDGVLTIDVDSKASYQNLKLIAYDAAGNPTDPIEYEVLVTSSWWVQFFMNKPLFFGTIAAIVIIAGAAGLLIVRRKKAKK